MGKSRKTDSTKKQSAISLNEEDSKKVKSSIVSMRKKFRRAICHKCGEDVSFLDIEGKKIPHDLDETPHWQTCTHSYFAQKKACINITKMLSILFIVKLGIDVEKEAGLTRKEAQFVQAILERAFKDPAVETAETPGDVIDNITEEDIKEDLALVEESLVEVAEIPTGDDPIGDPDEDLAPSEEAVEKAQDEEAIEASK